MIFETEGKKIVTPIYFGLELLKKPFFATFCQKLRFRLAIITDSNLKKHHGQPLLDRIRGVAEGVTLHTFKAGEESKNQTVKGDLEKALFQAGHRRDSCLIALGGGVTIDLVGYISATFCRGIPYLSIPTSLLAMVDVSLGGKTGINLPFGKNLVGVTHFPLATFIDFSTLKSLPKDRMREGLVEIIKHSLIADNQLFELLSQNLEKWEEKNIPFIKQIIYASCQIKKGVVESDIWEEGRRRILNLGHTIGHAIEALEEYQMPHGEAIAIGIIVESFISYKLKRIDITTFEKIYQIFRWVGCQLAFSPKVTKKGLLDLMRYDKKTKRCTPRFVILNGIGRVESFKGTYCTQINPSLLENILDWMIETFETLPH